MAPEQSRSNGAKASFRRVVFIDFDGVTHPAGGPAGATLPFEWVPLLAELMAGFPSVGVAVHSSWREQFSEECLRDFLEPFADQFVGVVPPGPKAAAIARYLDDHPEVDDVVILEDQPEEVEGVADVVVLCCPPHLGISCEQVRGRLKEWLSGTSRRPPSVVLLDGQPPRNR